MLNRISKFNTVWFAPAYNCNNKCIWCYASSQLLLIGGEPTLYPNLVEVVGKLTKKGTKVGLVTNGRRLKDRSLVRSLKKEGLQYLSISIEGYNERKHDSITQTPGSFLESLEGIENSLREDLIVSTNTTISHYNSSNLEKIIDLLSPYNLRSITFNICGICLSNSENSKYSISPSEGIKVFERIYEYSKRKKDVNCALIKLISPVPPSRYERKNKKRIRKNKCC